MIINHPPAKKNSKTDSTKAFCHLNSSSWAISLWVLCGVSHYSQVRLDVWKLIFRYFMQLLFLWHSLRFTRQVKVWLHHYPMAAVSPDCNVSHSNLDDVSSVREEMRCMGVETRVEKEGGLRDRGLIGWT